MYGRDFKYAGSKNIIKYGSDRNNLRLFAENYCSTHMCELAVFDYIGEVEDIISFEG
jgi:hypothetical protein